MWSPILLAIIVAILMAATFGCDRRDEHSRTSDYRNQGKDTPTTTVPPETPRTTVPPDTRETVPPGTRETVTDRSGDQEFFTAAAQANLQEVELGNLAAAKGSDAEVKKFGQQMIDDHSQANTKLMELARKKGVTLPTSTDDAKKQEASKLSGLSGADFDKKYAQMMVANHEKSIARYESTSKDAKDADVKGFAEKTLPTLQHHLKMARDLAEKVGSPTAD